GVDDRTAEERTGRPSRALVARSVQGLVPVTNGGLVLFFERTVLHGSHPRLTHPPWLYADRAAGGHRHHRDPDRAAAAGRPEGPRGRRTHPVPEQPQAGRPGVA